MDRVSLVAGAPTEEPAEKPWALRDLPPFPAVATRVLQLLAREDAPLQQLRIEARRRCWRHSLACALLSEELAVLRSLPADRAFTAGLLHDLGRLGLLTAYPTQYANMVLVTEENGFDLLQTERDLFDVDHCEAGRWLMKEWQLPQEYHEIAARHHHDLPPSRFDLLEVVSLACRLADTVGFEVVKPKHRWTLDQVRAALPAAAQARFDLQPEALRARISSLVDSLG